jgi:hypothetical protein
MHPNAVEAEDGIKRMERERAYYFIYIKENYFFIFKFFVHKFSSVSMFVGRARER